MSDLETELQQALEPLVLELEAMRREMAELKAYHAAATLEPLALELEAVRRAMAELEAQQAETTLEPLVLEIDAVRDELEALKAHRLDAPTWLPGVYRQGVVVQHFLGQYFEAVADTAAEPGDGVSWRRLGTHGFRYRGLFCDGVEYETGDLVGRDGSMMMQTGGTLAWLALRGKDGKRGASGQDGAPGAPGRPGDPGKRGADGASLVKLEVADGLIWAISSDGRRSPMALEAGGAPA